MSVSSGRRQIRKMKEPREEFYVGEQFLYSPLIEPEVSIKVETTDCLTIGNHFNSEDCKNFCGIYEWCGISGNRMLDKSGHMSNFIPQCHGTNREDKKDVYFRKV